MDSSFAARLSDAVQMLQKSQWRCRNAGRSSLVLKQPASTQQFILLQFLNMGAPKLAHWHTLRKLNNAVQMSNTHLGLSSHVERDVRLQLFPDIDPARPHVLV